MKQLSLKLTQVFLAIALILGVVSITTSSLSAQQIKSNICGGADISLNGDCGGKDAADRDKAATNRLNGLITQIINILTIIVGIVSVIFIIIGGFKYTTSGGDSGQISSAKNTVLYAIVGLVIAALAQFIVRFVVGKATSVK